MQQFDEGGGSSMYEEASCFAHSDQPAGFSAIDENTVISVSCAAFDVGRDMDECLQDHHHLKSSAPTPLNHELSNPNGQELQHHLDFDLEDNGQLFHDMLHTHTQLAAITAPPATLQPSAAAAAAAASWEESLHVLQEMLLLQQHQASHCPPIINDHLSDPSFPSTLVFTNSTPAINNTTIHHLNGHPKFPGESELLSLLQLPRCASSSMPTSTDQSRKQYPMTNYNPNPNDPLANYYSSSIDYNDPRVFLHQQPAPAPSPNNLPNYQQFSLKHLFHNNAPQDSVHSIAGAISTSSTLMHHHLNVVVAGEDQREAMTTFTIDHADGRAQFANPLFDFKRSVENAKGEPRGINHFATERQRREYLNEKYQTLRSLVPNPTKADRASIVQDAIEYVKELKRRVQDLELMVQDRNRQQQQLHKRRKLNSSEERCCLQGGPQSCANVAVDLDSTSPHGRAGEGSCVGLLRSSMLKRTSQLGTHVDVRIVEEEANIKLIRKKRALAVNDDTNLLPSRPPRRNPLLLNILVALHDLHLDLLSANAATIGDHHVLMLNTKIMEGSSTYASQVATKLLEVVDRQVGNNFAPNVDRMQC